MCIPQDGTPVKIVTVDLTHNSVLPATGSHNSDELEKYLEFLPGFAAYEDWLNYATRRRQLVNIGDMDPDQPIDLRYSRFGPYFLYRFSKKAHNILHAMPKIVGPNRHFKKVDGAEDVYGNAFIFKIDIKCGRPRIVDLDESVIWSAFKGKGISDAASLEWLSMQGLTWEEKESLMLQA